MTQPTMRSHRPALLTVPEVAAQLRVDPATIRRWITTGRLPATKPGRDYRVTQDAVDKLSRGSLVTTTSIVTGA